MFCTGCGLLVAGAMNFCDVCGEKVVVAGSFSVVELATVPPQATVQNMALTEQAL